LKGSGLIEGSLPTGFGVPIPSDDTTLRDDEDPLDPGDLDLGLTPAVEADVQPDTAADASSPVSEQTGETSSEEPGSDD
jgi:segregation and condensation protein B